MYLWNTTKLVQDLKQNLVSPGEEKNYYLFYSIFVVFGMAVVEQSERANSLISIITYTILALITAFWVNLNFKVNKGNDGKNFISRSIMIGVPVSIKITILSIIIISLMLLLIVSAVGEDSIDMYIQYVSSASSIILTNIIFYRINQHLKALNS